MSHILLLLYPKTWRQTYGEEFIALLDDLGWPVSGIWDAVRQALRERIAYNQLGTIRLAALAYFAVIEYIAVKNGITRNMFWLPHGVISYMVLLTVCLCLATLAFPKAFIFIISQQYKKDKTGA